MPAIVLEELRLEHWPEVARIYADGIATGNATFETEVPSWAQWDRSHLPDHRFVALSDGAVVGWVAVSCVSDRCVYGGVVENSVYVDDEVRGRGVGRLLLKLANLVRAVDCRPRVWVPNQELVSESAQNVPGPGANWCQTPPGSHLNTGTLAGGV